MLMSDTYVAYVAKIFPRGRKSFCVMGIWETGTRHRWAAGDLTVKNSAGLIWRWNMSDNNRFFSDAAHGNIIWMFTQTHIDFPLEIYLNLWVSCQFSNCIKIFYPLSSIFTLLCEVNQIIAVFTVFSHKCWYKIIH